MIVYDIIGSGIKIYLYGCAENIAFFNREFLLFESIDDLKEGNCTKHKGTFTGRGRTNLKNRKFAESIKDLEELLLLKEII